MKLKIKHIAPYIEYILEVRIENENGYSIDTVEGLTIIPDEMLFLTDNDDWYFSAEFNDFSIKPYLRPLNLLRKKEWYDKFGGWTDILNKISKGEVDFDKLCYSKIKLLFEHKFDVFGLIEKELAISY